MAFRSFVWFGLLVAWSLQGPAEGLGQEFRIGGEGSLSAILSNASDADRQLWGRYLPEASATLPLAGDVQLDISLSADLWFSRASENQENGATGEGMEAYRAWARFSTPRFEMRGGLQKISFGSAAVFRPLMWFDRVDPRDPLQITDGVWGLLSRAYLPGNVTVWGWVLKGEEKLKGWEAIPTRDGTAEGGGRVQVPLGPGEVAVTYHHRRFDLEAAGMVPPGVAGPTGPEERLAFDGKWDLEVGLWMEAVFTRQTSEFLENRWNQAFSLGLDYTFDLGSGLTVLAEHLVKEGPALRGIDSGMTPDDPAPASQGQTGETEPRLQLTSLTANYPFGVLDRFAVAVYRDWQNSTWFRLLEWRRTYDRWRFHLLAFWNPGEGSILPSFPGNNGPRSGSLGGRGAQLIVVFNH